MLSSLTSRVKARGWAAQLMGGKGPTWRQGQGRQSPRRATSLKSMTARAAPASPGGTDLAYHIPGRTGATQLVLDAGVQLRNVTYQVEPLQPPAWPPGAVDRLVTGFRQPGPWSPTTKRQRVIFTSPPNLTSV